MKKEEFLKYLESESSRGESLRLLTDLIVDTDKQFVQILIEIIKNPSSIESTNKFVSLLKFLAEEDFIEPLIQTISKSSLGSPWLADYMYVVYGLIENRDDHRWTAQDSFVNLLGNWLLTTDGGEISWKSASILSQLDNPSTKSYLLKGAIDTTISHLARADCIRGVLNFYPEEATKLLQNLEDDPDEHMCVIVSTAKEWLKANSEKG